MKSPQRHREHREWLAGGVCCLSLLIFSVSLLGCAGTTPRVSEVSHRTFIQNVPTEDQAVFLDDHASRIRIPPQALPLGERREEFRVCWTPPTIAMVKFQYRQVEFPNEVREQTLAATGQRATVFRVQGEDFVKGGTVSAWRVSLWSGTNSCVAELKSATW